LKKGDILHHKFSTALGRLGSRLSLEEVQLAVNSVEMDEVANVDFSDIICGDVYADSASFPFSTLEEGLKAVVTKSTGGLLRYQEYTVAVTTLDCGTFVLFDPHARNANGFVDGNGVALVMGFTSLQSIVEYLRVFIKCNGVKEGKPKKIDDIGLAERSFELLPVSVIAFKVTVQFFELVSNAMSIFHLARLTTSLLINFVLIN
jgi:hypothetical protein